MTCTIKHQPNTVSKCLLKLKNLLIPLLLIFSLQTFSQGYTTVDFHQAQNDRGGAGSYTIDWVNGILNATHTDYFEGIGVPQRIVLTGILANAANSNPNKHSLRFRVLAEKDKKHAYDFPISWYQAFKTAEDIGNGTVNELQNLFSQKCDPAFSAAGAAACAALTDGINDFADSSASFPDVIGNPGKPALTDASVDAKIACFESYIKPNTGGAIRYGDRKIEIWGNAAISNVEVTFIAYQGSGKDLAEYLLTWESSSDMVMIRFATRLAAGNGTCGYGSGQGAGSISGGPYHVTLERLDDVNDPSDNAPEPGVSLGSQDNQIMSNAIQIPPPTCGLTPGSSGCTNTATSFNVTYSSTDAVGATVLFYFISNTAGAKLPNGVTATGSCASNTYSVVADVDGNATIAITPANGTAFTAGSFKIGACVTTGSGTTSCEQASATVIDEASVVAKVDGNITTAGSPFSLNTNQANPSAALTSLATLNGVPDNTLFSSFTWAVPVVAGNNATTSNLSATNLADVTFTPTAAGGGGFVAGLYAFEVTAVSTANGCIAKDTVYIDASGTATCPGITGPGAACENQSGLTYTAGATSPGDFLTYVWSISGTATISGADPDGTKSGVSSISVTAGSTNFTVILSIKADNGQIFTFEDCEKDVTVTPAPTVTTIYNPPACDESTFTVDVTPGTTKAGYTYSIDQPGNNLDFSGQDQTPANDGDPVQFTGLTAGDGFIVTVNANVPGSTCTGTSDCESSTNSCTTPAITQARGVKTPVTTTAKTEEIYKIVLESPTKVNAAPNPYSDKVRFDLVSGLSGYGTLELYNTLGQKIGVVYQGYIQAGRPLIREYEISKGSRSTLIYVFKVGDQKVTGKLIGLK